MTKTNPSQFPPDIRDLVGRHQGVVGDAERAAGISLGTFSKIVRGGAGYTDFLKSKVAAALAEKPPTHADAIVGPVIPESCPPLLGQLIRHLGTKAAAIKFLGTSDGRFYTIVGGTAEMPPGWIIRIKAELGQPIIGHGQDEAQEENDAPPIPPFVAWDGKTGNVKLNPSAKDPKGRTIKNVPMPIVRLLEKHGNNVTKAAAATGLSAGGLKPMLEGTQKFTEERQLKVHNAMHSVAPAFRTPIGEDIPDRFSLGLAFLQIAAPAFDRIKDIADILNGRLVFKMNTGGGWLIVYKMGTEDLEKFKRLAKRDAKQIVCP